MKEIKAEHVAEYFLRLGKDPEEDEYISNLKLQKLCYYAQGIYLALKSSPLFKEKIEAWQHGPVCRDLYNKYKIYGNNRIQYDESIDLDEIFNDEQKDILTEVYNVYAQFSAWRLREMTHEEAPWKNAFAKGNGTIITEDALKDFFKECVHK